MAHSPPRKLLLGSATILAVSSLFISQAVGLTPPPGPPVLGPVPLDPAREILNRTSQAFNQAARQAVPAVVSVHAIKRAGSNPEEPPATRGSLGIGSGIVIRADGIILTSNHVVSDAERITVGLDDKTRVNAMVVGSDPRSDIAVLKLETPSGSKPHPLQVIRFGDSDRVQVGDWALAVGSPFGLTHSVTSGIVSAKGRGRMGVLDIEDFLQTDAAINPGNSGGPLLNINGEMIGMNAAIYSQTGGFIGIGFSIPANLVKQVAFEILDKGKVSRGWLGVMAQDIDGDLAKYFEAKAEQGALVSQVVDKSPASKSDLKVGDVITRFDSLAVTNSTDLRAKVSQTKPGKDVKVDVLRQGKPMTFAVKIQEQRQRASEQAGQVAGPSPAKKAMLGLSVQDVPAELEPMIGVKTGQGALVVDVIPGSPAFDSGLVPGDVILKANGKDMTRAKDVEKFARELPINDLAVLYVQRGPGDKIFLPVRKSSG